MLRTAGLLLLLASLAPRPAVAQDVELLGERWGTPLPEAYRTLRSRQPDAFTFRRGRATRLADAALVGAGGGPPGGGRPARTLLGPRDGPVEGDFRLPVLLGLFSDSQPIGLFDPADIQEAYFGQQDGTISAYYAEVSRGMLALHGDVTEWLRSTRTQAWVANGDSGLGPGGRVGSFIKDLLERTEGVDWARYDNDGPDGIPDSGDDDGYVDALAVLHPTSGGECGGPNADERIWSHRWALSSPGSTGSAWTTDVPSANGGFIKVDDYLIQPAYSCLSGLNEIGVFTHELGHAFGLPDLYDTDAQNGKHQGVGTWGLMGTGSWGCDDDSPDRPCHMGAWSKLMLGWADVVDVPAGSGPTTVTLPPVASTGTVYRVASADGSGEYFLLENRRRTGFDASLHEEGLLVWQVDPDWVAATWRLNEVNAYPHRAVWLRQADGLDELGRPVSERGDAGDPFPLVTAQAENRTFHASSSPASTSFEGTGTGVTLLDIERVGEDVTFRLLSRRYSVTLRTDDEGGPAGVFSVDGTQVAGTAHSFPSAPFEAHEVAAAAGVLLEPGVRRPFDSWLDAPDAPRVRTLVTGLADTTAVARYAGRQVELALDVRGGQDGVAPAEFVSVPFSEDLWFVAGTEVSLEARPRRGFSFLEWTGELAGQGNPATIRVEEPVQAGADFEVIYAALPDSAVLEAAREHLVGLEVENGTLPIRWSVVAGTLPRGLRLDVAGLLSGTPLETGRFTLVLEARDGLGLTDQAEVMLEVTEPALGLATLAAPFLLGGGPEPTEAQARFLDLAGNDDGVYDLGDFRAWVLDHPELPMTAPVQALVAPAAPGSGGAP